MCRVSTLHYHISVDIKLKTRERERTPNFDRIRDTGFNSGEKMRVRERT